MPNRLTLKQVQAQLKISSGINWTAGPTAVSDLAEQDRNIRLGLRLDEAEMERVQRLIGAGRRGPAPSFAKECDWRNREGKNWTTSIKDQGNCGSCVAFATVGALETRARIFYGKPEWAIDLSEADLFFCGAGRKCSQGWWPTNAFEYARVEGIAEDSCFPYEDHDMDCRTCGDRSKKLLTVVDWQEIAGVEERKEFLDKTGPLVLCMAVYQDFFYYKQGVYSHVTGDLAGYHAVCCIGYSEAEQCWICKNSWGADWGEAGYFKIHYGEADIESRFAAYGAVGIAGTLKPSETEEDSGEDWAESLFVDHLFEPNRNALWALVKGTWRYQVISDAQVGSLGAALFQAGAVRVYYHGETIDRVVGVKTYAAVSPETAALRAKGVI